VSVVLAKAAAAAQANRIKPAAVPSTRKRVALVLAGIADLVQMGYFPIFGEGALSLLDDALDALIALGLLLTLGFRWRLLLALGMELVPGATLFPTWTAVVLSLPTLPDSSPRASLPPPALNQGA
jgi:hypothetical protein